jgi:hypothetical protein
MTKKSLFRPQEIMDHDISAADLVLRQPGGLDEEELDRLPGIVPDIVFLLRFQAKGISLGYPVLRAFHHHQRAPVQEVESLLYPFVIMGAQGLAGEKPDQPPLMEGTPKQILRT